MARNRRTPTNTPARPACTPTGDMSPWIDDRPRRCTVCAEPARVLALPDGSDWYAVDADGSPAGRAELPPICGCPSLADLRAVTPSRWYGHGIPSVAWRGGFHMHNADGCDVVTERPGERLSPCYRMPTERRAEWIAPLATDRVPPECCGWPMRWAPRGWSCRESGAYFVPALPEPGEEAAA